MRILLTTEAHVSIGAKGQIYIDGPANYSFWSSYLMAFDKVTVLARGAPAQQAWSETARADGPGVFFRLLPDYYGPLQLISQRSKVRAITKRAILDSDAYLLRVPGLVGHIAWLEIEKLRRPYALEVLGDPWDSFSPGTWPSLCRPLARRLVTRELREMCNKAAAIHYVTHRALQRRFPPGANTYTKAFSDAVMDRAFVNPDALMERYRRIREMQNTQSRPSRLFHIGFIGSLSRLYKGLDVLLGAISLIADGRNSNLHVAIAGDGQYLEKMKRLAMQLRIQDRVRFLGQLPHGKPIFDFLDSIDLLVLPSRAEGLPRALLEAMARGCPCVATEIGGVDELLVPADMVPCGDAKSLAEAIVQLVRNPARLREMADRNLKKAAQFSPQVLMDAHREFLSNVRFRASERIENQLANSAGCHQEEQSLHLQTPR